MSEQLESIEANVRTAAKWLIASAVLMLAGGLIWVLSGPRYGAFQPMALRIGIAMTGLGVSGVLGFLPGYITFRCSFPAWVSVVLQGMSAYQHPTHSRGCHRGLPRKP